MADSRKILIDHHEFEFDSSMTLIQACSLSGVEIPRFCYHERLSIAGNCRMCLVEVKGIPKPQASCALQIKDLPSPNGAIPAVLTHSKMVQRAREGVMEFLLINHPLDCPICDQGGECDLQDQSRAYGNCKSRYRESKRSHGEISLGPLIKTAMTRCIYCTRCVRFMSEIAGFSEIGMIGRGENVKIVSYLDRSIFSELQGNLVDLCPVGALTSRPYAFTARPWELQKTPSIDVMDALGANIRVDTRDGEVMRILPRENAFVNEEWISDKSRFAYDGLRVQRLDRPYVKNAQGRLIETHWNEALRIVAARLEKAKGKPRGIAALAGDLVSIEPMWLLKNLCGFLGSELYECRQNGAFFPEDNRSGWLCNTTIAGIADADAILLIGSNPRIESAVLNIRLRKAWLSGAAVGVIGDRSELGYDYAYLGDNTSVLDSSSGGFWESTDFGKAFAEAKKAVVILGVGALARKDGRAILAYCMAMAERLGAEFNVLHTAAARVGGLEIGFTTEGGLDTVFSSIADGQTDTVFLLGADEIDMNCLGDAFVIYQGSHGDAGAHRADVILPAAAYTEQSGVFMNLEGRPQMSFPASALLGQAREDWKIIQALLQILGCETVYSTIEHVRDVLFESYPRVGNLNCIEPAPWKAEENAGENYHFDSAPIAALVQDFYLTNPIARSSQVMVRLSKLRSSVAEEKETDVPLTRWSATSLC